MKVGKGGLFLGGFLDASFHLASTFFISYFKLDYIFSTQKVIKLSKRKLKLFGTKKGALEAFFT